MASRAPGAAPGAAWAARGEVRAKIVGGEPIEAMKTIMRELRSFGERIDVHSLPIDTSMYYKNPGEFGAALRAIATAPGVAEAERRVRTHEVAEFASIVAERGRAFLALGQPARALQDLQGAVGMHAEHDALVLQALDTARTQVGAAAEEERQAAHAAKVPVTVLTGFLGAGKTTLLNYILRADHGRRYAVIENEVGQIGIDNQLLNSAGMAARTEETVTLLDNGCLCCTVRSDLITAIHQIIDRADALAANELAAAAAHGGGDAAPRRALDAILIETTGMADPGPVCKTFYAEDKLRERTRVDGVLTVVDALHFERQLQRLRSAGAVNESAQQVAFADAVLLNKADAADPAVLEAAEAAIKCINAGCPIVRCSLATRPHDVPLAELLGADSFCLDRVLQDFLSPEPALALPGAPPAKRLRGGTVADFCSPWQASRSRHDTGVATCAFSLEGAPLVLERFLQVMNTIRAENAVDLYRYKGVVCVKEPSGALKRAVFQGVHDLCQFEPRGKWPGAEPPKSQLVFIGRQLDQALWGRLLEKTKDGALEDRGA